MISIIVIVFLAVCLLFIARRSSKNRDTILIEILLGLAGSVVAAVVVASFPRLNADNFLGQLDTQFYEAIFGTETVEGTTVGMPEKKIVTIEKNVSSSDRKIEGVYAGLIRSIQNGTDVLGEKAYVLRVEPSKNEKVLEIYQGGEIEYKIRIDGKLAKDGVTWLGETKSVLKGGSFVQDDLKLLLSPEAGRIDWHQHDKVQQIRSIGTLYKIDEDTVSERISAVNRIKNTMFICAEESAKTGGSATQFLFVPLEGPGGLMLQGPSFANKVYADLISGTAKPYEDRYDLHIKTRFKRNDFPNLSGMKRLKPDLASLIGFFDKDYSIGVSRPGEEVSWFKQTWKEPEGCKVFFVGFPATSTPSVPRSMR